MTQHLKKAELHVHLEGTAPPQLIKKLAERNHIKMPESLFTYEDRFVWDNFIDFLQVYEEASKAIRMPIDYYDLTYDYLKTCAEAGTIYVEMMYSPEHAERSSGIPSREHVAALDDAIRHAQRDFAIEGRILMTCVRHYGVDACIKVALEAAKEKSPFVVGFGMGGDELGFPPGQFAEAYAIAHAAGLPCTVHAGEFDGPEGIREALDTLPITRLGHGVRAIEDEDLLDRIIDAGIVFEVCPNSNVILGVFESHAQHPLLTLINKGAKVTLSSDDPPYFQTNISKEYATAQTIYGLDDAALNRITRTSIEASFADAATKQRLLAQIID